MDYECLDCGYMQDYKNQCHSCDSTNMQNVLDHDDNGYYANEYQYDMEKGN